MSRLSLAAIVPIVWALFLTNAHPALAYPVLITSDAVPWLMESSHSHLIAIAPQIAKEWRRIPLQIDEVEDGAAIVFRQPTKITPLRKDLAHPGESDPFEGILDSVHRLVIDDDDFETCDEKCLSSALSEAKKLCNMKDGESSNRLNLTKIDLKYKNKSAFIANCRNEIKNEFQSKVKVDLERQTFTSDTFTYKFRGKKNILLDRITLEPEDKEILGPSELQVYLKPKYFVNMRFDDKDLISRVTSYTAGPLSTGVEVSFALNVLSFKINPQICCDVSIYKDALYFPVMLDLPFEGSSFAKGSGLFYGLNYAGDVAKDIEFFAPKKNKDGAGSKVSTSSSSALLIKNNDKLISVGFRGRTQEDGANFAPSLAYPADLKKSGFPNVKSKFGLYYDVTKLKKGFHNFNVWFYVGTEKNAEQLAEYAKNGIVFTASQVR